MCLFHAWHIIYKVDNKKHSNYSHESYIKRSTSIPTDQLAHPACWQTTFQRSCNETNNCHENFYYPATSLQFCYTSSKHYDHIYKLPRFYQGYGLLVTLLLHYRFRSFVIELTRQSLAKTFSFMHLRQGNIYSNALNYYMQVISKNKFTSSYNFPKLKLTLWQVKWNNFSLNIKKEMTTENKSLKLLYFVHIGNKTT